MTSTEVGYTGGRTDHPSYGQVCSGTTGHAESVKLTFDESKTSYKAILKRFLETQRPTENLSLFHGGQYRSAIFYFTPAQEKEAKQAIQDYEASQHVRLAVSVEPAKTFWRAEEYHQQYYKKNHVNTCKPF